MKIRKNQKYLTTAEWDDFICAFRKLKEGLLKGVAKPSLDDFADEHAKAFKDKYMHDWLVHSDWDDKRQVWHHKGTHFLAWHRVFLNEFENRLRREVPGVTIPYWNAFADSFPDELKKISDNEGKRVPFPAQDRDSLLPNFGEKEFEAFQLNLEVGYHNHVHAELGRTMKRRHSPRDAGFWLHHAFVDRQWGHWFEKHDGALPSTIDQPIKGDEIVTGKKVKDVLHTTQLGYVYDNGIYYNIEKQGSSNCACRLSKDLIVCAKLPDQDYYAKLWVPALTSAAAFITMQQFPYLTPGSKVPIWAAETMYCDLRAGKLKVDREEAHIRIRKETAGSSVSYVMEAVNGTKLGLYSDITNFAANDGDGAIDPEMLCI